MNSKFRLAFLKLTVIIILKGGMEIMKIRIFIVNKFK